MAPRDPGERARDVRIGRALGTLMALVLGTLGLFTMATQHYAAQSAKHPGANLALHGTPAIWMGGVYLALAGLPLMTWCRSARVALAWGALCLAGLVGCLAMAIRAHG